MHSSNAICKISWGRALNQYQQLILKRDLKWWKLPYQRPTSDLIHRAILVISTQIDGWKCRVINIWDIRKPYNQNSILQIYLNTEEEYVQAGLLFQTFYFPLKLKKKKKQKKTTDMPMAEWVGGSSCEVNHTSHSVLWKSCFKHAYNYYLLQWHTSLPYSTV